MIKLPEKKSNKEFIRISRENLLCLPKISGLYLLYDKNKDLLYIGKSADIRGRVLSHNNKTTHLSHVAHNFYYLKYMPISDVVEREIYETYYINLLKPKLNTSKVYTYTSEAHNSKYHSLEHIKNEEYMQKRLEEVFMTVNL